VSKRAFYLAGAGAFIVAGVYLLVRLGAAGWFTLTFAVVAIAATVLLVWPVLLAGAVAWALWKYVGWRSRRRGGMLS
jgi:hypothetical protein